MKTKLVLLLLIAFSITSFAQMHRQRGHNAISKIEELEKVKLIETLNLDEQTSIKFFARRNEHMNKMRDLKQKGDELLDKISESISKKGDENNAGLRKMISQYLSLGEAAARERTSFVNSLGDILSTEQISRLLVFEKRFREELRGILFRQRMKGRN